MDKEMLEKIRNQNGESLRLIFKTYMYADPTLLRYQEELAMCGEWLFEPHEERTPEKDRAEWDDTYWGIVMLDLQYNFSKQRFDHVREVAEAVETEKINAVKEKLASERKASLSDPGNSTHQKAAFPAHQNESKHVVQPTAPTQRIPANPPLPPPAQYMEEPRAAKEQRLRKERNRLILSIVLAAAVLILIIIFILNRR